MSEPTTNELAGLLEQWADNYGSGGTAPLRLAAARLRALEHDSEAWKSGLDHCVEVNRALVAENAALRERERALVAEEPTVTCEECAFRYGAEHTMADGTYSCPMCEVVALDEALKAASDPRHVVPCGECGNAVEVPCNNADMAAQPRGEDDGR